jgi:hypothetical protein
MQIKKILLLLESTSSLIGHLMSSRNFLINNPKKGFSMITTQSHNLKKTFLLNQEHLIGEIREL